MEAAFAARDELARRAAAHSGRLPLVPEETLNHLKGFFNVVLYGMTSWGDLFSPRQTLSLSYLFELIQEIRYCHGSGDIGNAVQPAWHWRSTAARISARVS
jgi:adenine-specific DNA methylase